MKNWHDREHVTRHLRLREYDYALPGAYFVTICTEHRLCLFGEIVDELMVLSPAGVVIESWWDSISRRFADVVVDDIIIMPNHLHGIIAVGVESEVEGSAPLPSLDGIIQWFKGMTTKDYITGVKNEGWQRFPGRLSQQGYYEHIVRSDRALERLRAYIAANPSQWSLDQENPNPGIP